MRDYHASTPEEVQDRRPIFFFVIFVFLSAMFGIVVPNNLAWMSFFWEVTTLCSFLLIGYTRPEEANGQRLARPQPEPRSAGWASPAPSSPRLTGGPLELRQARRGRAPTPRS